MSISSMTGFARVDRALDGFLWSWELKGVNGRNLDLRCRLPVGYESLDPFVRSSVADKLRRGSISVILSVNEPQSSQVFRVNEGALMEIVRLIDELGPRLKASPPRIDGLLALRGILEIEEAPLSDDIVKERQNAIKESFNEALDALRNMRGEEGRALGAVIDAQLTEVDRLRASAVGLAATNPAALRDRLQRKLVELLPPMQSLPEDRLAIEVALLAQRSDVREELDRLQAHLSAARNLLSTGGAVGRKFDFLCQEFNREANTLCSKADDLALTNLGIDLKAAIEQLREQVQNIE